jgi:hypothetical protein
MSRAWRLTENFLYVALPFHSLSKAPTRQQQEYEDYNSLSYCQAYVVPFVLLERDADGMRVV